MTGTQLAILAGLTIGLGAVLAFRALHQAPPALGAALAQLSAEPLSAASSGPTTAATESNGTIGDRWDWLPTSVAQALDSHLGVSGADLSIIGMSPGQLAARKVTLALAGLLAPAIVGLLLLPAGLGAFVVFPAFMGLALAAMGWLVPTIGVRDAATAARLEFRSNLESFLTLVAGERRARGSVEQALEEAAEVSGSMPFVRMRRAIRRAALSGRKPWNDLRDLGEELQVVELRNLADIAEVAADGAAVYNTLLATARSLRHAELTDNRTQANEVSERMSRPLALLVLGLTMFVLVPFMLRMFNTA